MWRCASGEASPARNGALLIPFEAEKKALSPTPPLEKQVSGDVAQSRMSENRRSRCSIRYRRFPKDQSSKPRILSVTLSRVSGVAAVKNELPTMVLPRRIPKRKWFVRTLSP
jgi:hypothetical protein